MSGEHQHDHDGHAHHDAGHGGDHDHSRGLVDRLRDLLAPHRHETSDSIASALEASREGMRALKISLAGLAVTAGLQLVVVAVSGSVALLATRSTTSPTP